MGLDMYLTARVYVSGYPHSSDEEREQYDRLLGIKGLREVADPETPSGYAEVTAAYWRKANAIHAWFVRECQGGVDECQRTEVDREQLQELRDLCQRVLDESELVEGEVLASKTLNERGEWQENYEPGRVVKEPSVAQALLPTQEGFFFGDTEYDEYYYADLEYTVKQLDRCLAVGDGPPWVDFEYRSSW